MKNKGMLLILMGMKHCGKSSIGRRLSKNFNLPFYDLDREIENIYDSSGNTPCRKIFTLEGKEGFQKLESAGAAKVTAQVESAFEHRDNAKTLQYSGICALGGGTIENSDALLNFEDLGFFIFIQEKAAVLYERIMRKGLPPFLDPADPWKDFLKLYNHRTTLYRSRAQLTIDAKGQNQDAICKRIAEALQE